MSYSRIAILNRGESEHSGESEREAFRRRNTPLNVSRYVSWQCKPNVLNILPANILFSIFYNSIPSQVFWMEDLTQKRHTAPTSSSAAQPDIPWEVRQSAYHSICESPGSYSSTGIAAPVDRNSYSCG